MTNMMTNSKTKMNDQQALEEASRLQDDTKTALRRMQERLDDAGDVGATTLDQLQQQRQQQAAIDSEANRLHANLEETERLHKRLGKWFAFGHVAPPSAGIATNSVSKKDKENATIHNQDEETKPPKKKSLWKRRPKHNKRETTTTATPSLLNNKVITEKEIANANPEHQEHLQQLADNDEEIDQQLDVLDHQLTDLLELAHTMHQETNVQNQNLTQLQGKMDHAHQRQAAVNQTARRLLLRKK